MKVLFDHQIFAEQNYGGISRYYFELIRHLNSNPGIEAELSLKYSDNTYLKDQGGKGLEVLPLNAILGNKDSERLRKRAERTLLAMGVLRNENVSRRKNLSSSIRRLQNYDYDIFHPTYYDTYYIQSLRRPLVITVYDMIHELYPEHFPLGDEIRKKKKQLIHRADAIIAISNETKRDIITFYDVDPGKVTVIYLGNPLEGLGGEIAFPLSLPKRYLLYVGKRNGYKNFYFTVLALEKLLKNDDSMTLVCAGGGIFDQQEARLLAGLGLANKVFHHRADDAALKQLYTQACLFILPSLYEGFGLPLLEAMNCGCPVLASNKGALPEIGGDAVLYYEPKDAAALVLAVKKITGDERLRTTLKARGLKQALKYSWANTAQQTLTLYRKLV